MMLNTGNTSIASVEDSTFSQDVLAKLELVIVFFYSDSCEACRVMVPAVERSARILSSAESPSPGATVVRLDTDANPTVGTSYGVEGTPTFVMLEGELRWLSLLGAPPGIGSNIGSMMPALRATSPPQPS